MNFFYSNEIINNTIVLRDEEFKHATKSLRKRKDDEVYITDGMGSLYTCRIEKIDKTSCIAQIVGTEVKEQSKASLTMGVAPPKNSNRFDWFVEKSVEIGVDKIIPIVSKNSERKRIRQERLQKIALSAMKQSKRVFLPKVHNIVSLDDFVNNDEATQKFVCHYGPEVLHLKDQINQENIVSILIGPEGDFTKSEVQMLREHHYQQAIIGDHILRTETAAIIACNIFNLANQ